MTDTVISVLIADAQWDELNPQPQPSSKMAENATHIAYLSHSSADWSGVTHTVVGQWDEDTGEPLSAITNDYQDWVRKFGNSDGVATGALDSTRWAGHNEQKLYVYDDTDPENIITDPYPSDDHPFELLIERTLITDDQSPDKPHGWKVTMLAADPLRAITARSVGIYDENDTQIYASDKFAAEDTDMVVICPRPNRTADEVELRYKLQLGNVPEGEWFLPVGEDSAIRGFWSHNQ
jgi:hypothetical protein